MDALRGRSGRGGAPSSCHRRSGRGDVRHAGRTRVAAAPDARCCQSVGGAARRPRSGWPGRRLVPSRPVPTSADLDDPLGFVAGETRSEGEENADFDTALEELLKGESNEGDENPAAEPATEGLELSCRRTLQTWSAPNPEQDQLRRQYLDHLAKGDGWSRACVGAHLTASSLICAAAEGKVLLTLHARIGRWLQTGGHIESTDPTLEAAAEREAHEESGLADLFIEPSPLLLSKHEVPCGTVRPTYHLDVQYLVRMTTWSAQRSARSRWTCVVCS